LKAPDRESLQLHGHCETKIDFLLNMPRLKDAFFRYENWKEV